MSQPSLATAPDHDRTGWPPGVPYIIGNEGCERFSFYGMKSILFEYSAALYVTASVVESRAKDLATSDVHLFIAGVYALPMIGATIADRLLGKYRTILWLSLVYCAGHLVLALTEGSLAGLHAGLALIAVGSGGIKPCVSANVGDQFGRGNWHLLRKVFQAFYFIINFGSFFATLLIPLLKKWYGPGVAFGLPGILMFLATVIFWAGRRKFVHVPPAPGGRLGALDALASSLLFATFGSLFFTKTSSLGVILAVSAGCFAAGLAAFFVRQRLSRDDGFLSVMLTAARGGFARVRRELGDESADGALAVLKVVSVFAVCLFFWACFDQHSTSWIRQAQLMDLHVTLPLVGAFTVLPSQTGAMNPVTVLMLIPLLNLWVYPALERAGYAPTPLRRMTLGMFVSVCSFAAVALLQARIDASAPSSVPVAWQFVPYVIMSLGEVLVSATALEFAYSQAPRRMKSTLMAFWNLTVALGAMLTGVVARTFEMSLSKFFWLFTALLLGAAVLFAIRAAFYSYRDWTQR
jgi:POT family proton-dependent oligopeptide transporter